MTSLRIAIVGLFLFVFPTITLTSQENEDIQIESIEALEKTIQDILTETNTHGVGITLVTADGPMWSTSLGKSDLENDKDADENTMFRIGSTSKMFVSLSILKLQEQGKISLQDKVRDLAPEIEFTNPWAETNPILVEHLLEHTTGWDDLHLCEYGLNDPTPLTLKEGLDYHPHSRISRWVPGTRMSYCNAGPPVAAYIVEKITGKEYESFVKETFWDVMGMENMTYLKTPIYDQLGAKLYEGSEEQEYWHILMRPSGSINASPIDMAKMVQFFINRGSVDSLQIISEASLQRMENSETTLGAKAGLEVGYGLSNYTTNYKSSIWHGHNGGVNGGAADLAYFPEAKVGYAIMINTGNGNALRRMNEAVRSFLTRDFELSDVVIEASQVQSIKSIDGYYTCTNPRIEMLSFIDRLADNRKIWTQGDTVFHKDVLGGSNVAYVPASNSTFRSVITGKVSMAQIDDPLAGASVQMETASYKKVSWLSVYGPLIIGGLWVFCMIISLIWGLVWFVRRLMDKIDGGPNILVRIWPLLGTIFIVLSFIFFAIGGNNPFEILAGLSFVSMGIMICTAAFGLTALWSLINILKTDRKLGNRFAYQFNYIRSILHVLAGFFLLYYGVIGLQTWA